MKSPHRSMVLNMWTQGGSCVSESCGTFARWDPTAGSGPCSRVGGLEFITQSCLWSTLLAPGCEESWTSVLASRKSTLSSLSRRVAPTQTMSQKILLPLSCPCPDYLVTARRKLTNRDVKLRFSERRNAILNSSESASRTMLL